MTHGRDNVPVKIKNNSPQNKEKRTIEKALIKNQEKAKKGEITANKADKKNRQTYADIFGGFKPWTFFQQVNTCP